MDRMARMRQVKYVQFQDQKIEKNANLQASNMKVSSEKRKYLRIPKKGYVYHPRIRPRIVGDDSPGTYSKGRNTFGVKNHLELIFLVHYFRCFFDFTTMRLDALSPHSSKPQ